MSGIFKRAAGWCEAVMAGMGISPPELLAKTGFARGKCERFPTVIRDGIRQFLPDAQSGPFFRAIRVVPRRLPFAS